MPRPAAWAASALITLLCLGTPLTTFAQTHGGATPAATLRVLKQAGDIPGPRAALAVAARQPIVTARVGLDHDDMPAWVWADFRPADVAPSSGPRAGGYVLQLGYPLIDRAEVFVVGADTVWRSAPSGDQVPRAHWPDPTAPLRFALPDTWQPGTPVLVRITGSTRAATRVSVQPADASPPTGVHLGFGVYYGLMLALFVYTAFLLFMTRDTAYGWYLGWLGSVAVFQAVFLGHLQTFVWPATWAMPNPLAIALMLLAIAAGCGFARTIAEAHRYAPALVRPLKMVSRIATVAAIAVWPWYLTVSQWLPLIGIVGMGLILHVIVSAARRGYTPAAYVLIGYACVLPGGLALALRHLGVIEANVLTEYGLLIGSGADAVLQSLALAERIRLVTDARDAAERQARTAQQRFSRALIKATDAQRADVARELHDGIGANLAIISGGLRRLTAADAEPDDQNTRQDADRLRELGELARNATDDIRQIARRLHPQHLDRLGLAAALEDWVHHADTPETRIDFRATAEHRLPAEVEHAFFRIAQEAINNARRHAGSARIDVRLTATGPPHAGGELRVRDRGRGMPADMHASELTGMGLTGMQERATAIGATFSATNHPDGGVLVALRWPMARPI